ncbi:phage head closure protein [Anaerostipes caccae]|uniref:phage head closure protein n=1 Tax=Anaerostipes caccae TaxID=105841 RepID=UPI0038D4507D
MRLRNLKQYQVKTKTLTKDEELNDIVAYEPAGSILADIQPMSGKAQAEQYGVRITYMVTAYTKDQVKEDQLVDVNGDDYKVVRIADWGSHKVLDLEKVIT